MKRNWIDKLNNRYRLVILQDDTFEEKASLRLSRLNIIMLLSTIFIIMIIIVASLMIYTPLKLYLLGYDEVTIRKELVKVRLRVDELEKDITIKDEFLAKLREVIEGKIDTTRPDIMKTEQGGPDLNQYQQSELDSAFRVEFERNENNFEHLAGVSESHDNIANYFFFTPITGYVTNEFDHEKLHYGVDIVAPENTTVKAAMDGTVTFAAWTLETGNVIVIQHDNNMTTYYKHNSVLLKKIGNFVKAGDVIAYIGNTGELTSGTHLHFELWYKGIPLDPTEYIVF